MDQLKQITKLSFPVKTVDRNTFRNLSHPDHKVRYDAALQILDAARSCKTAAPVAKYMDANALAKAVEDPNDHVSAVATAATHAVAHTFAHFLGIEDANPGDVCKALQEANERLAYLAPGSAALAAGNHRPSGMHRGLRTS